MTDWEGVVFVACVLALAVGGLTGTAWIINRGNRRERIDIEAHNAYMDGGGYPAYYEVYRKYGIIKKGK